MIYRPEIDGLRAIAVISVILFHAGFEVFSGGFVGVDIFFVISGYLITSIILSEVRTGRFSILRFYERRVRRILPALVVVLLCCLPFAWTWMRPDQFLDFSRSLVAVMLFASNILFWRESGYFAAATGEKPLLHTWSLAVEEQYYLFFPLLILLFWRFGPRRLLQGIIGVSLVSLLLSEWASGRMAEANFYLLPTRAWELLAGSISAFLLAERPCRGNDMLAAAGLVLIAAPVFLYDATTRFPGFLAVPTVLGTVLIVLFATKDTRTAKLLSLQPVVGIGLLSYSAYLWHQPLFAFARIRTIGAPSPATMAALSLASVALAWISWRYVERPFRQGAASLLPERLRLFTVAGLASATILAFGLSGVVTHGFPARTAFSLRQQSYFATAVPSPERAKCHQKDWDFTAPKDACEYLAQPAKVAVFGDSHAIELAYGLALELKAHGGGGVKHFSFSGCAPVYETESFSSACAKWTHDVLRYIADDPTLTHVVVSYRATSAIRTENEKGRKVAEALRKILANLSRTKTVIYVMQAPELPGSIQKIIQFAAPQADTLQGATMARWTERRHAFDTLVLPFIGQYDFFDTPTLFCNEQSCLAGKDGTSFYFDDDHMSVEGARIVARAVLPFLQN